MQEEEIRGEGTVHFWLEPKSKSDDVDAARGIANGSPRFRLPKRLEPALDKSDSFGASAPGRAHSSPHKVFSTSTSWG